ncbi:hypothetical protein, partial [Petrimonas sp.]|uniref:hypothetical protein n=1 Tax=Petrimonas sp. TaxID=2023866 RepID=UPI003F5195B6
LGAISAIISVDFFRFTKIGKFKAKVVRWRAKFVKEGKNVCFALLINHFTVLPIQNPQRDSIHFAG